MTEEKLLKRIKYLKSKLNEKYLTNEIKDEIEEQINFLFQKALYFY